MCRPLLNFTLSLLVVAKMKIQENAKFHFFFVPILQNKQYYAQVLPKRFHLNVHTIGFRLQTKDGLPHRDATDGLPHRDAL